MHGGLKLGPSVSKIARPKCETFDYESGDWVGGGFILHPVTTNRGEEKGYQ